LLANLQAFLEHVSSLRPPAVKGEFLRKISISSTMGPGVRISWEFSPCLTSSIVSWSRSSPKSSRRDGDADRVLRRSDREGDRSPRGADDGQGRPLPHGAQLARAARAEGARDRTRGPKSSRAIQASPTLGRSRDPRRQGFHRAGRGQGGQGEGARGRPRRTPARRAATPCRSRTSRTRRRCRRRSSAASAVRRAHS
jgi:hypothetical protein